MFSGSRDSYPEPVVVVFGVTKKMSAKHKKEAMKMPAVQIIPAIAPQVTRKRVAAYCRVSSDSDDQLNSFAVQVEHYTHTIQENTEWEFAGIYADEAVTGTRMDKRSEFQRMIADCRAGKIDRILVKSVSRFARNTVDCIQTAREMSQLGISILFEEEHIDTGVLGSEMLLGMLSAVAQEESLSISKNLKWGIRKRMQTGEFITCHAPFGYSLRHRDLIVNEKEQPVIEAIFSKYLSGQSCEQIADWMNFQQIPTKAAGKKWRKTNIVKILRNEKYQGDALLQKTYTPDCLPLKNQLNNGEMSQFYIRNAQQPIITQGDFQKTQALLTKKYMLQRTKAPVQTFPLSQKIVCGLCGQSFCRTVTAKGTVIWTCRTHYHCAEKCLMMPVKETDVYQAFLMLWNKLVKHREQIFKMMLDKLVLLESRQQKKHPDYLKMMQEISVLLKQNHALTRLRTQGVIDEALWLQQSAGINNKIADLRQRSRQYQKPDQLHNTIVETASIYESLKESAPLSEFDAQIFRKVIRKIEKTETAYRFYLTNGLVLQEGEQLDA